MPEIKALFYRDWSTAFIPQILQEIYIHSVYTPFVTGRRDMVIADWGANIGITAQYFANFAKQIYAVEPATKHLEILSKTVKFNETTNIKVCPYAISNETGKTHLYLPDNTTMYSMENMGNTDKFEEVDTLDPEEFFKREKIEYLDLLKADVEGSESKVFSSDAFRKISPKIKVIVGEHHAWDNQSKDAFMNMFKDLGYVFTWNMLTDASTYSAVRI